MLAPIIVKLLAIGGAALLGAGAGTGWYFTVGGGALPAPGAPGDSPTASVSDGLFHENDLDQFLLSEEQVKSAFPPDLLQSAELHLTNDSKALWCTSGAKCGWSTPNVCDVPTVVADGQVIEPVAVASQYIGVGDDMNSHINGYYVVMQYPTPEMARAEAERVRAAVTECASAGHASQIIVDEMRGSSAVMFGDTGTDTGINGSGPAWAVIRRDNVVIRVGFGLNKPINAARFTPFLDHMVANANAAAPGNQPNTASADAAAPHPSTSAPTPSADPAPDFSQITTGDYSSLAGTWTQIARGGNAYDGKGVQYSSGGTNKLSISSTKIDLGSGMAIEGTTLTDATGSHSMVFREDGENIIGSLADENTAINWSVKIYPRGTSHPFDMNGTPVSNSTDVIVIWTSNMSATMIFVPSTQG